MFNKPPENNPGLLRTRHVFLDTEVYRQCGHNPSHQKLRVLAEIVSQRGILLHISDITSAEVERQIEEKIDEDSVAIKKALKPFTAWNYRHPNIVGNAPSFDKDRPKQAAISAFKSALGREWRAFVHKATQVPAPLIFAGYFKRQPPFAAQKSKEFPDAFVVWSLAEWCTKNSELMYVVTEDKVFREAAAATGVLLPLRTLDELLQLIAVEVPSEILAEAQSLVSDSAIISALGLELAKQISQLGFLYDGDLEDGEVSDADLNGDPSVRDLSILYVTDDRIGALVDLSATFEFEVDYEDYSGAIFDREDGRYLGVEYEHMSINEDVELRAFVTLARDRSTNVSLELLTTEITVHGPPGDM
jgi:hypothetical protein